MFDKTEYREVFSRVTASKDTYRRIISMKHSDKQPKGGRILVRVLLVAAVISLLAVSVSAAEHVQSWFAKYFSEHSNASLSTEQIAYIEENEQNLNEKQTVDDWTVELRSAISDGTKAYIIIGITAPENVNLTQRVEDDSIKDWFGPGNAVEGMDDFVIPSVPNASVEGNYYYQVGRSWEEDGDGLDHTKNMVISLSIVKFFPTEPCKLADPFGPDIDFEIVIKDIVREYDDEEYCKELMEGKYAGQTDVMFTPEETERMHQVETLVEGVWNFTVNFAENEEGVELLSQPIEIQMDIWRNFGDSIEDYAYFREPVTITSVIMRPLTVTLVYEDCGGGPTFSRYDTDPCIVMKDGSRIVLEDYGGSGVGGKVLAAETPVVLNEADHILLPDGTIIPMPEIIE